MQPNLWKVILFYRPILVSWVLAASPGLGFSAADTCRAPPAPGPTQGSCAENIERRTLRSGVPKEVKVCPGTHFARFRDPKSARTVPLSRAPEDPSRAPAAPDNDRLQDQGPHDQRRRNEHQAALQRHRGGTNNASATVREQAGAQPPCGGPGTGRRLAVLFLNVWRRARRRRRGHRRE